MRANGKPVGRAVARAAAARGEEFDAVLAASTTEEAEAMVRGYGASRICETQPQFPGPACADGIQLAAQAHEGSVMRDFRDLLMNAPILITLQRGKDQRFELFNLSARKAVGERDFTGKMLAEVFPELEQWLQKITKVVRSGTPYFAVDEPLTFDWSGTGKAETRYLTCVCQPLLAADGTVDGSVMFAIDVTASVLARTLSPRDRAWFVTAVDGIATPVVLAEPETRRILFANAAARELSHGDLPSGTTFGQAVGLDTGYFCTDASGSRIAEGDLPAARASRGEVVDAMELLWHTPFGSIALVCFAEMVPATDTLPSVVVLSFFDASAARRLERELVEAQGVRDDFLGLASHELRTPLAALKLQVQSLLKQYPQVAGLAAVERAAARMDTIVERMLASVRIREGDVPFAPENMNLCEVVDDVLDRLRPEVGPVSCAIARVGAGDVRGCWDRTRIKHVITNLVTNAIRFGDGKPSRVECRDLGERVSMAVSDHGIGIAPADQERIFERFARAVSSRHYGGLGLGLWITREILTQMGGSIAVESALEQGATFTVELPKKPPQTHGASS
jgi:signal transduction histidine kinase